MSVLIRVRNEARSLSEGLRRLSLQRLDVPWEVVVVDNESEDDSAAVAMAAGARVFVLPRELFGYGRAANVGVDLCRGRYVVMLSAHSWPCGTDWLRRMVDALRDNPRVGAAFSRQVPRTGLSRPELRRFEAFATTSRRTTPGDLVEGLRAGADVHELCFFSNAASAFRRDVAKRAPFCDLPYAEDRAFALDCLLLGHDVAYVADATVRYEFPATLRSRYRVGRGGQIAKQLLRDKGTACGRLGTARGPLLARARNMSARAAGAIGRCFAAAIHEPRTTRRTVRYGWVSLGTQAGILVGAMTWRRHRALAGLDAAGLLEAKAALRPYVAAPDGSTCRVPNGRPLRVRREAHEPQMP